MKIPEIALSPRLVAVLLAFFLLVTPIVTTGAIWVQNAGLLSGSAMIYASDAPAMDRYMATVFHKLYGSRCAVCDGTSDETEINAALAAGYKVILPTGGYTIDDPITAVVTDVTIEGYGWDTIISLAANGDANMITVGGNGWTIRSLKLDGNGASQGAGNWIGIYVSGKSDFLGENLEVTDCDFSAIFFDSSGSIRCAVRDSYLHTNGRCGVETYDAVSYLTLDRITTKDNTFSGIKLSKGTHDVQVNNYTSINDGYVGLEIDDSDDHVLSYNVVATNILIANSAAASVRVWGAYRITITGLIVISPDDECAVETKGVSYFTISGFNFYNLPKQAFYLTADSANANWQNSTYFTFSDGVVHKWGDATSPSAAEIYTTAGSQTLTDFSFDNIQFFANGDVNADNVFIFGDGTNGGLARMKVSNCMAKDHTGYAVYIGASAGMDDSEFSHNTFTGTNGIFSDDGENLRIIGNKLENTTPLDLNNDAVNYPIVADNDCYGSTNNPSYYTSDANGTGRFFSNNIDKDGGWFATTARTLFVQAAGYTDGLADQSIGKFTSQCLVDNNADHLAMNITVPDDFSSFTSIEVVWISNAGGTNDMYWSLNAQYGASGEAYSTHSDSPALGTTASGGNNIINVQEPANALTLSSLAAGDYLGVYMTRDATNASDTLDANVWVFGMNFNYVAEDR